MMQQQSLSDTDVENAVEAAGIDCPPATMVPSGESSRLGDPNGVDNNKPPMVFGSVWREVISVFTLACAPGLNVCVFALDVVDLRR